MLPHSHPQLPTANSKHQLTNFRAPDPEPRTPNPETQKYRAPNSKPFKPQPPNPKPRTPNPEPQVYFFRPSFDVDGNEIAADSLQDEGNKQRLQSTVAAQTANLHSAQMITNDNSWRMPKKRTVILSMPPSVGESVIGDTKIQKRFFFDHKVLN